MQELNPHICAPGKECGKHSGPVHSLFQSSLSPDQSRGLSPVRVGACLQPKALVKKYSRSWEIPKRRQGICPGQVGIPSIIRPH